MSDVTVQELPADINKLLADLDKMGTDTQVRLLDFHYEVPNADVQSRLQLPRGMQVQKAIRVRHYQGVPFSFLTTYVPENIGKRYTQEDLVQHSMQALLRKIGMRAASAEQTLTATLADADHASALAVDAGSALLCIKRVVRDAKNTPLEYLIAVYNPKRFEYRMTLSPKRARGRDAWVTDGQR
jgi:GntR family transcriptional regulator